MTKHQHFITFLKGLKEDRAALAALRRGLGEPPGAVAEMGKYIYPFFGANGPQKYAERREERAYFLIASLFALHPEAAAWGNMGRHLQAIRNNKDETAVERRFTQLLAAHPDDLPNLLRQAVSLLKAKEEPIHWEELLSDVLTWERGYAQQKWARSFWGDESAPLSDAQSQPQGD